MNEEIKTLHSDRENRTVMVPGLAKRFQFYQDLRGYITDLVECLDEKVYFVIFINFGQFLYSFISLIPLFHFRFLLLLL